MTPDLRSDHVVRLISAAKRRLVPPQRRGGRQRRPNDQRDRAGVLAPRPNVECSGELTGVVEGLVASLPQLALLVDDADDMRLISAAVLERAGWRVETARDGREALEQLRAGLRPAVIVSDVDMPVMNGAELLAAVRGELGLRDTPVIFHSASEHPIDLTGDSSSTWLSKATDERELLRVVEAVT